MEKRHEDLAVITVKFSPKDVSLTNVSYLVSVTLLSGSPLYKNPSVGETTGTLVRYTYEKKKKKNRLKLSYGHLFYKV